jgi:hypothetical protein
LMEEADHRCCLMTERPTTTDMHASFCIQNELTESESDSQARTRALLGSRNPILYTKRTHGVAGRYQSYSDTTMYEPDQGRYEYGLFYSTFYLLWERDKYQIIKRLRLSYVD